MFTNAASIIEYVTAGNATITLKSLRTEKHLTYRVRELETSPGDCFFVALLTGPDNEAAFTYLGMIRGGDFVLTRKSRMTEDSTAVKAWRYFWHNIKADRLPADLEVRHEGRCGRCGRKLTVPSSIDSGIGPECGRLMGRAA